MGSTLPTVKSLADDQHYKLLGMEVYSIGSSAGARRFKNTDWDSLRAQVTLMSADDRTEQSNLSTLQGLGLKTICSTGGQLKEYCSDVHNDKGYIQACHDRLRDGRWEIVTNTNSSAPASTGPSFTLKLEPQCSGQTGL